MDPQAVLGISAVVVTLVQLLKASPLPTTGYVPLLLVVFLAGLAVALWGLSHEATFARLMLWDYFTAWVNVTLTAAGAYGIVRTPAERLMSTHP